MSKQSLEKPYIPASQHLPELTFKAIILGIILAAILGGSNAYLGLKIGQTVTACIPAAIVSMAILRFFRQSNILENNMVQTIASAGEVMAAAAIFTLPALLIIGYWETFEYTQTAMIVILGGTIGILFSIPLRRALIIEEKLIFPEGVATAEVLKAGRADGSSAKPIVQGGVFAALIQFGQGGLQLLGDAFNFWGYKFKTVIGFGTGLSPVMLGAGYIVGIKVCISLIVGAIIMYGICIPITGLLEGVPDADNAYAAAMALRGQLKYVGVGAMVTGGISALLSVLKPIRVAVSKSFATIFSKTDNKEDEIRTEKDIPFVYVLIGLFLLFIPVYFLLDHLFKSFDLPLSTTTHTLTVMVALVLTFVIGFLVASISGYMSGLVGNSSNPLSGILISSVMLISLALIAIMSVEIDFSTNTKAAMSVAAGIILATALIACFGAISLDNLQDLKTGHVLGATPWKQQVALFFGVVVSGLVIVPVLQILFDAYGMGGIFPREGMDPSQNLPAPQAVLIATVAKGMVGEQLPMHYIMVGGSIGIVCAIIDTYMKKTGKGRLPALGVALGLYLPLEVSIPIFIGGLLSAWVAKNRKHENGASRGILFASGMIAGEALMGIVLAIPFAAKQSTSVFRFVPDALAPYTDVLGLGATIMILMLLVKTGRGEKTQSA